MGVPVLTIANRALTLTALQDTVKQVAQGFAGDAMMTFTVTDDQFASLTPLLDDFVSQGKLVYSSGAGGGGGGAVDSVSSGSPQITVSPNTGAVVVSIDLSNYATLGDLSNYATLADIAVLPTGSGTANTVTKWASGSSLGNSLLTDDGTTLSYGAGKFTVTAATGAVTTNSGNNYFNTASGSTGFGYAAAATLPAKLSVSGTAHVLSTASTALAGPADTTLTLERGVANYLSMKSSGEMALVFNNATSMADGSIVYDNGSALRGLQFRVGGNNIALTIAANSAATFASTVTITPMTAGSVIFSGAAGLLSQDNTKLFWDNTNKRLGVGKNAPDVTLDVSGAAASTDVLRLRNTDATGFSAIGFWDSGGVSVKGATGFGNTSAPDTNVRGKNYWRTLGNDMVYATGTGLVSTTSMMLFDATGNVNIGTGTSDPAHKLRVQGNASITTYLGVGGNADTTNSVIDAQRAGQANIRVTSSSGTAAYTGFVIATGAFAEKWFIGLDGTGSTDGLILRRGGTSNDLKIDTSGNFTIGVPTTATHNVNGAMVVTSTVSNTRALHVKGNSDATGRVIAAFNANAANVGGFIQLTDATAWNWGVGAANSTFDFEIRDGTFIGTAGTARFRISKSTGGTSVLNTLDVSGDATFVGNVTLSSTNKSLGVRGTPSGTYAIEAYGGTTGGNIKVQAADSTQNTQLAYFDAAGTQRGQLVYANNAVSSVTTRGRLMLWHDTSTDYAVVGNTLVSPRWDLMVKGSNGRVGIGTDAPASLLHIISSEAAATTITLQNTSGTGFSAIDIKDPSNTLIMGIGHDNAQNRNQIDTRTLDLYILIGDSGEAMRFTADKTLQFQNSTGAVSAASTGRIRYTTSGQKFQVSMNAGAYVDLMTSANISGTADSIPKFTGTNTLGNSALVDDGTNLYVNSRDVYAALDTGTGTRRLNVGRDATTANATYNGFAIVALSDGSTYLDAKMRTGGHLYGRLGVGAESSATTTWLDVTKTSETHSLSVSMLSSLSADGNVTLGNSTSRAHTVNGRLTNNVAGFADSFSSTLTSTAATYQANGASFLSTGTFDAAAANRFNFAVIANANATRSVGPNSLTNTAYYANAVGGQSNYAIYTDNGDNAFNNISGSSTFVRNVFVNGNASLGNATSAVHTVNGVISVNGPASGNIPAYRSVSNSSSTIWGFGQYDDGSWRQYFYDGAAWNERFRIDAAGAGTFNGAFSFNNTVVVQGQLTSNGGLIVTGGMTIATGNNPAAFVVTETGTAFTGALTEVVKGHSAGTIDTTGVVLPFALSTGVSGRASSTKSAGSVPLFNIGTYGTALGGDVNIGVEGEASTTGAGQNIGVYGIAMGGSVNYAGYFDTGAFKVVGAATFDDTVNTSKYVRATVTDNNDAVIIGTASKQWSWYPAAGSLRLWEYTTTLEAGGGGDRITITAGGNIAFVGGVTLGDAVGDAHTLNGTLNANSTAGSNGEVLTIVSGVPKWAAATGGTIGGSGTSGKLAKFTAGTTLGDSLISDNGATVTVSPVIALVAGDVGGISTTFTGTVDATAAARMSNGLTIVNSTTRGAGGNGIVHCGIRATSTPGTGLVSIGVHGTGGHYGVYSDGNSYTNGNHTVAGNIDIGSANGSAALTQIAGIINFADPPAAGPITYGGVAARLKIGHRVLTSTSVATYTPTAGTTAVRVRMVGGGGGGGGWWDGVNGGVGGGGAAGAYFEKWFTSATGITGGNYQCGAAGGGGNNATGGTGGDTTIVINGTTYTAKGGLGGPKVQGYNMCQGGQGQAGTSAGDVSGGQQAGGVGLYIQTTTPGAQVVSGAGGSSPFGAGGGSQTASASAGSAQGKAATGYGAGGGGGMDLTGGATHFNGGVGTQGIIIIEEYV